MWDLQYQPEKGVGYAYNMGGTSGDLGLGLGGFVTPACKESDVISPSDMYGIGCSYSLFYARYYAFAQMNIGGWHSDQANVLFTDGHIDLVKSNVMVAPTDASRRHWNRDNQPHPETWVTLP